MATFTEAQVSDLAELLNSNSDEVGDHLEYYADIITESDKTKVLDHIASWQAASTNFTSIHPNVRNFGARINPGDLKGFYARTIANLLHFSYAGAGDQTTLARG